MTIQVNKLIKKRRLELGLTLKDVAKALNIAESTVSRYESNDIQNMGIDKIEALSKVLDCSPVYLMGWEDSNISQISKQSMQTYGKFEQLLKDNNVSAYKVSKETGIATSTLSDWKNGRSTPKVDKLQKIAEYFHVSTDYFVGDRSSTEETVQINPLTGKKMTKRELSQYEKVMNEATLMFNNEDVSEEDKEKLMMALNDMFWKSKQKNKEKYAKSHKKNI